MIRQRSGIDRIFAREENRAKSRCEMLCFENRSMPRTQGPIRSVVLCSGSPLAKCTLPLCGSFFAKVGCLGLLRARTGDPPTLAPVCKLDSAIALPRVEWLHLDHVRGCSPFASLVADWSGRNIYKPPIS